MNLKYIAAASLALTILLFAGMGSTVSAQGRGRGGGSGGGRPTGAGQGNSGVDRGLGTASGRSQGRSDDGLGTASDRSMGRSDRGIDRARMADAKARSLSEKELNRYRGLSRKLGTTPEEMRARYQAALLTNPDLTYGQFVAANVVADNLGSRFPNITSSAILRGLENGDSLGRTLRNLGMTKEQAKQVERDAERSIKETKTRNR